MSREKYWKDMWDKEIECRWRHNYIQNKDYLDPPPFKPTSKDYARVADYILKKYGRNPFNTYGKPIRDAYFEGDRFAAIFIPLVSKSSENMEEILNFLKEEIGSSPIYKGGDLAAILKIFHEETGMDLSTFNIVESKLDFIMQKDLTLGFCILALCTPIIGWGYLFFKLFEHIDSTCSSAAESRVAESRTKVQFLL